MSSFAKPLLAVVVIALSTAAVIHYTGGLPGSDGGKGGHTAGTGPGGGDGTSGGRRRGGRGGDGPAAVVVAPARVTDVPVHLEGVGTVKARNTVTVRPQVDGRIMSVEFQEGQDVRKGDVLVRIDPATYQAAFDQAVARKRLTEVQLDNAMRDLARFMRLTTSAVSEKTVDTQRAQVAQLEAQVKADDAAIASARALLDYTVVTAPMNGRTGIRMVDEGNLVRAADAGVVVITEVQPIAATFNLPQQHLIRVQRAAERGVLRAEAVEATTRAIVDIGALTVVDNQVDSQTGTVRMKAEFPNARMQLWPGQFVNVRLLVETLEKVVVVPAAAVQRGPGGAFVYVLDADGAKVGARQVALGPVGDREAVVQTGVAAGDLVVTSGFGRLADGAAVTATPAAEDRPVDPGAASAETGSVVAAPPSGTAQAAQGEPAAGGDRPPVQGEGRRGRRKDARAGTPMPTP